MPTHGACARACARRINVFAPVDAGEGHLLLLSLCTAALALHEKVKGATHSGFTSGVATEFNALDVLLTAAWRSGGEINGAKVSR